MFETDYPHPTSLSPGPVSAAESPKDHLASAFAIVPEDILARSCTTTQLVCTTSTELRVNSPRLRVLGDRRCPTPLTLVRRAAGNDTSDMGVPFR